MSKITEVNILLFYFTKKCLGSTGALPVTAISSRLVGNIVYLSQWLSSETKERVIDKKQCPVRKKRIFSTPIAYKIYELNKYWQV